MQCSSSLLAADRSSRKIDDPPWYHTSQYPHVDAAPQPRHAPPDPLQILRRGYEWAVNIHPSWRIDHTYETPALRACDPTFPGTSCRRRRLGTRSRHSTCRSDIQHPIIGMHATETYAMYHLQPVSPSASQFANKTCKIWERTYGIDPDRIHELGKECPAATPPLVYRHTARSDVERQELGHVC